MLAQDDLFAALLVRVEGQKAELVEQKGDGRDGFGDVGGRQRLVAIERIEQRMLQETKVAVSTGVKPCAARDRDRLTRKSRAGA